MAGWLAGQKITAGRENDNAPFTVNFTTITAASTTTTGPETIAMTTPNLTFRNNRAYRITYKGGLATNTGNQQGTVLVRKTNLTGAAYITGFRMFLPASGTIPFYLGNVCTNTSGADITAVLVGTFALTVAVTSGVVNIAASASGPCYIHVEDIGLASDYAGATALT